MFQKIRFQANQIWRHQVVALLANLKVAIALLLAIAVFSILGTVIEQGQTIDFYRENYPEHPALFGFLSYKVILAIGLEHVYGSWWFLALLILFGTSLTACTFNRQLPILKASKRWFYYTKPQSFVKLPLATEIIGGNLNDLAQSLQSKNYKVYQADDRLYARKGLIGRIGPIVVHASMLLVLIGSIWGSLTGFIAQEMVPSGETFQVKNITEAGAWSANQVPKDWSVRVNRFWIDYTPKGSIDQFYSDLSVLDRDGKEVDRETIHVNKPLKYKGVSFYQANWDIHAIRFTFNNSPILQLPVSKLESQNGGRQVWGTWIPTKPDLSAGITLITPDLQGTFLIYDEKGNLLTTVRTNQSAEVNGVTFTLKEAIGSTGLQIKADPGIPIVYAGFGLLMLGVIMSYVSHSQVWALQVGDRLYVGGKTNRAQVSFESELIDVTNVVDQSAIASGVAA
ncbi:MULTISPECIES: cytochrome c biogenesis protein [Pseudanabaena]|uniref:cytochrome c biogenesis protein n=1 Tax=Pseudanabaena TaxID=1152 RepID=UPI00247984AF|nr:MULTISPECIES: cytochrome c biogenesis protein [Pseudanabaena]MEA5490095.1 cytochrome c biogenesis protein [Pseudanabaena sp. CCNP1317]WGS73408.1 cytochrome c biogenesis protein [Pseudanabaena galeata CCNP1313]